MIQSNSRSWGFLGVEWANLAVVDLDSEEYRWLGPLRFDIKGLVKVFDCDSYGGKISYLPVDDWSLSKAKQGNDVQVGRRCTLVQHIPPPHDEFPGPAQKHFNTEDKSEWKTAEGNFSFFYAGNLPKILTSPGKLCHFAKPSDGALDLLLIRKVSRADLAKVMLSLDDDTFKDLPFLEYHKVKAFYLEPRDKNAPIGIDGEHTTNESIYVEVHQALALFFFDKWNDDDDGGGDDDDSLFSEPVPYDTDVVSGNLS
eukprot:TRINITY_DN6009_c0_g1_i5.p1 TRINITY_DN6009_c0_g1~~TRINITY_DN6009_c0_g1_i5.p1  ORF type:complete len:255 (-),score=66.19 TRINITY_DN6009_c0_g1_i5:194-958(-)